MAKITDFKNPISGDKGNLLNASDWIQNVLGVAFFIAVIATGQKLLNMVNVPYIQKQPAPIFKETPTQTKGEVYI